MRAVGSLARGLALAARSRWSRAIGIAALLHLSAAAPLWLTVSSAVPAPNQEAPLAVELAAPQSAAAAPQHERHISEQPEEQTLPQAPPRVNPAKHPPMVAQAPVHSSVPPVQLDQEKTQPPSPKAEVADAAPAPSRNPDKADNPTAPVLGREPEPTLSPQQSWESKVLSALERCKRYPPAARWQQQQDTVYLRLQIGRDGAIMQASVSRSQGFQALDDEVIAMTRRVGQLPPPPPDVSGSTVALTIPVEFYIGAR